jgi:hypothetical protein
MALFFWTMINLDDRLINILNENELWILVKVAQRMKGNRMTAWPSIETLAKDCGWDERTVKKHRKGLLDKGILKQKNRPGKSPVYSFLHDGVGVYWSLKGEYEEDAENGGAKIVPPAKNVPPDPPQKMYPEVINNTEVITESTLTSKSIPAKEKKESWSVSAATLFDEIRVGNNLRKWNWMVNESIDFGLLNKIRTALLADVKSENKIEVVPPDLELEAFRFLFRYGFEYLKSIADSKGGPVQFTPRTIKNNYNQIIEYARSKHNKTRRADSKISRIEHELDTISKWED